MNASAYLAQVLLFVFISLYEHNFALVRTNFIFQSCLWLATAVGYAIYGSRLYRIIKSLPDQLGRTSKLKEVKPKSHVRSFVELQIGIGALVCTIDLFLKSGLLLIPAVINLPQDDVDYVVISYIALEIIPITLIIWILRELPPLNPEKRQLITYRSIYE